MKKILYITFILVQLIFADDTKYGAAFLELGVGARPLGMGSAYVALSNDAPGFYWNPAGLAFQTRFEASVMHANLFNGLETHNYFNASMPMLGGATVSIGAIGLFVDDLGRRAIDDNWDYNDRINNTDLQLTQTDGTFSTYNIAAYLTIAKFFRWNFGLGWQYNKIPIDIGVGLNIKYLTNKIDDKTGSGGGIDLGYIMRFGLYELFQAEGIGDLSFGINLQDIAGTQITWDTDSKHKDRIEHNIKYGFAYVQPLRFMSSQMTFAYDINSKYNSTAHLGAELLFRSFLAVRAGASAGRFTTGAGIYFWKFKVDYAYQGHDLGNSHRVSLIFGW